jgi:peptidoglycan/xylan/chitin deacetylase (PgdA/CDA1 family)
MAPLRCSGRSACPGFGSHYPRLLEPPNLQEWMVVMLLVKYPILREQEKGYIIDVMLGEFLGLNFRQEPHEAPVFSITGDDGKVLVLPDVFFRDSVGRWLCSDSLPPQPLATWVLDNEPLGFRVSRGSMPIIYGEGPDIRPMLEISGNRLRLGLDIFGSAFFMLTRYEECVKSHRDQHGRFPATASLAYEEGFLDRPIVNEYLEILWTCLSYLWPDLQRRRRGFRMLSSHDVDSPYRYFNMSRRRLVRHFLGQVLRSGGSMKSVPSVYTTWRTVTGGQLEADPHNTFDLIMDMSEERSLQSTFFFITDHSAGRIDGDYDISSNSIRRLLKHIADRGHEIGLHCSYNSYRDPGQTQREFERLLKVCGGESIKQSAWGGRQHFLRWETPTTFRILSEAGLAYDSTLAFADRPGFRCGVCYEYPAFDLERGERLMLRERPLVVMECTVMDERYANLGHGSEAYNLMKCLKDECRRYDGDFTILWHNSRFVDPCERALYEAIVDAR